MNGNLVYKEILNIKLIIVFYNFTVLFIIYSVIGLHE